MTKAPKKIATATTPDGIVAYVMVDPKAKPGECTHPGGPNTFSSMQCAYEDIMRRSPAGTVVTFDISSGTHQ